MSRRASTSKHVQDSDESRKLRILATGTLFITHTLTIPAHPSESEITRASTVHRSRGGSVTKVLHLLASLSPANICPYLVAAIGRNSEAQSLRRELEQDGVDTRYCRIWPDAGIPSSWVLHAADTGSRTVINHNPLPDMTHEDFIRLVGPAILPEKYKTSANTASQHVLHSNINDSSTLAPFDWIHFEGRSIKTTMNNMMALAQLAESRAWRGQTVFSLDVGRKGRQGVEALIPFADVIFLSKAYALSQGAFPTPKAFLLSLSASAPKHALLITHWGHGSAVLSLPTKEYFQSSGWVDSEADFPSSHLNANGGRESVSSSWQSANSSISSKGNSELYSSSSYSRLSPSYGSSSEDSSSDSSSVTTTRGKTATDSGPAESVIELEEEIDQETSGTYDAFVAGMIYALSRKILPGAPYIPDHVAIAEGRTFEPTPRVRWRLDECLRFATELAGRKARRRDWNSLAGEMARAGWLDS